MLDFSSDHSPRWPVAVLCPPKRFGIRTVEEIHAIAKHLLFTNTQYPARGENLFGIFQGCAMKRRIGYGARLFEVHIRHCAVLTVRKCWSSELHLLAPVGSEAI